MSDVQARRERPILFSAPMVRAILDGRKTQTRRVIKPQPPSIQSVKNRAGDGYHWMNCADQKAPDEWRPVGPVWAVMKEIELNGGKPRLKCRFGIAGDYLWIREGSIQLGHEIPGRNWQYRWPKFEAERGADWFDRNCLYTADLDHNSRYYDEPHGTLNKLFMPRWASRVTLNIKSIRVEPLQNITEEDAIAEGVQCAGVPASLTNRGAFAKLWTHINGPDSWDANPWVWAISFSKEPNQ